jgi:hypothetical protein
MPDSSVRATTKRFKYYTWFNRFDVPEEADFFALVGFYPLYLADTSRGASPGRYRDNFLLLTNQEMQSVFDRCRPVREGKVDRYFGVGFDDTEEIIQTRGDREAG